MITEEPFRLLRITPPFSFLDDTTLSDIAENLMLEFYPRGHILIHENGPAAEHLSIIQAGAVKIFTKTNEGEMVFVDYRTRGDHFGLLSFVCGEVSRDTVMAIEDTSCYLVKKETVMELLNKSAPFAEFCFRSKVKRLAEMTYREIHERTLLYGGGDKLLFTSILNDLATRNVITASEDITIREAAEIMASHKISSLVLLDSNGLPSGVFTDRDLRNKVVSKGRDIGGRVGDIMSVTIIKSEARDYCFEALMKMIRYNIHHLLVVDKGDLKGIITNHDLMMLQGTSPLSVARGIEDQNTIDGLVPVSRQISKTLVLLIREGAKASHINRIITEINDRLLKKILEIAETRLGPPPVDYCWIVFGSEGRREQTFRTDQDNAIIYEDAAGREEEAAEYFSAFASFMKDALERCGFPPCTADYMASNPRWRQPLSVWKKFFSSWINNPIPEAVLKSLILFDFRPVHGNVMLAETLRAFLGQKAKNNKIFLAQMAGIVTSNRPPIDIIGRFSTEKKGEFRGKFNIKMNCLCPIIDAARLSALEMKVYHTSTVARLVELKDSDGTLSEFLSELEYAFEFLMSLRLRHQFRQIEEGVAPDNFINPHDFSRMEQKIMKEAFKLIMYVQKAFMTKYDMT
jgi:CBS domain-containing protein